MATACNQTPQVKTDYSTNEGFLKAVAFGEINELNELSQDVDKALFIRLFQNPIYEDACFEETHGICKFEYFLTVSTYDEYPETNIYTLKQQGEIKSIEWLNTNELDTAILKFTMQPYTQAAYDNNSKLVNDDLTVKLRLTPNEFDESLSAP